MEKSLRPKYLTELIKKRLPNTTLILNQCFGSGWIRIIWPDPDPHQETGLQKKS